MTGREQEHHLSHTGHSPIGHDATCLCGWESKMHPTSAAAAAQWREHAGLPALDAPTPPPAFVDGHPLWCDLQHVGVGAIHTAYFGLIGVGDRKLLEVEIADYTDDRGPVVALVESNADLAGTETVLFVFTATQARDLACCLAAAADVLDATTAKEQ